MCVKKRFFHYRRYSVGSTGKYHGFKRAESFYDTSELLAAATVSSVMFPTRRIKFWKFANIAALKFNFDRNKFPSYSWELHNSCREKEAVNFGKLSLVSTLIGSLFRLSLAAEAGAGGAWVNVQPWLRKQAQYDAFAALTYPKSFKIAVAQAPTSCTLDWKIFDIKRCRFKSHTSPSSVGRQILLSFKSKHIIS